MTKTPLWFHDFYGFFHSLFRWIGSLFRKFRHYSIGVFHSSGVFLMEYDGITIKMFIMNMPYGIWWNMMEYDGIWWNNQNIYGLFHTRCFILTKTSPDLGSQMMAGPVSLGHDYGTCPSADAARSFAESHFDGHGLFDDVGRWSFSTRWWLGEFLCMTLYKDLILVYTSLSLSDDFWT